MTEHVKAIWPARPDAAAHRTGTVTEAELTKRTRVPGCGHVMRMVLSVAKVMAGEAEMPAPTKGVTVVLGVLEKLTPGGRGDILTVGVPLWEGVPEKEAVPVGVKEADCSVADGVDDGVALGKTVADALGVTLARTATDSHEETFTAALMLEEAGSTPAGKTARKQPIPSDGVAAHAVTLSFSQVPLKTLTKYSEAPLESTKVSGPVGPPFRRRETNVVE